jgi:hypothetical protein
MFPAILHVFLDISRFRHDKVLNSPTDSEVQLLKVDLGGELH